MGGCGQPKDFCDNCGKHVGSCICKTKEIVSSKKPKRTNPREYVDVAMPGSGGLYRSYIHKFINITGNQSGIVHRDVESWLCDSSSRECIVVNKHGTTLFLNKNMLGLIQYGKEDQ